MTSFLSLMYLESYILLKTLNVGLKMQTLEKNQKLIIAGLLMSLMLLTRPHMISHLQDASWAIFFLVGFYLRSHIAFGVFMVAAIVIDLAVIQYTNISNYCMTPSYPFIIPAYAVLWFAGRWFAMQKQQGYQYLLVGATSAVVATVICFGITNVGFYLFSEHFETMSASQYIESVSIYLPAFLKTTLFYLASGALVHWGVQQFNQSLLLSR
jgi:hypothetical protein